MKTTFFVLGFLFFPIAIIAQNITGKVIDEKTENPLPFANVISSAEVRIQLLLGE
jgi:hypothetical protein